jgi:hypothetical protein
VSHSESYTDTGPTSAFYQGVDAERERIIKLLEPEVNRHYELGLDASAAYLEQTIELIKGEQK